MHTTWLMIPYLVWAISPTQLKEILPAVGQVLAGVNNSKGDTNVRMEGSGVVIDPRGIVVTNLHVISDGGKTFQSVFFNLIDPENPYRPPDRSRLFKAEVLLEKPEYDLVLLKIVSDAEGNPVDPAKPFRAIPLGKSDTLNFLDEIYAIGFPRAGGSSITVTRGQISGKEELDSWLKIDAQVTHGSSGGAALNKNGELIGIPTKVRPDIQEMDTNGDGFPDASVSLGSVGLIRPVELVAELLSQVSGTKEPAAQPPRPVRLEVKGLVQAADGSTVGKALVGLLKAGSREATVENLLTWTRADENGVFILPVSLPPGPYTFRVRADGYEIFLDTVELNEENTHPIIKLKPAE